MLGLVVCIKFTITFGCWRVTVDDLMAWRGRRGGWISRGHRWGWVNTLGHWLPVTASDPPRTGHFHLVPAYFEWFYVQISQLFQNRLSFITMRFLEYFALPWTTSWCSTRGCPSWCRQASGRVQDTIKLDTDEWIARWNCTRKRTIWECLLNKNYFRLIVR